MFGAAVLHVAKPAPQTYEHELPLHVTVVAFVALQALPHPPQWLVVVRVVHVLPHCVSRQVHEPFWQSGLGWAQVASFVHVPAALHASGVVPLHWVCAGAQTPEQTPATHVSFLLEHETGLPHVPLLVQE